MEYPDLIVESKTMSADEIQQALEGSGYEGVETSTLSDRPAAQPAETTDEPTTSSVPPEAPGETAVATGDETGSESETEQPLKQDPPKPTGGFKKKLAKLEAERDRYAREADELRKRLADQAAPTPETATPEAEAPPAEPAPKPKWEDFAEADNQIEAYNEALFNWKFGEMQRERQVTEQSARTQAQQKAFEAEAKADQERWMTQLAEAKDTHPDFDEVIANPGAIVSGTMNVALHDSEKGAELAYWLGQHPEECARIAKLTEVPAGSSQIVLRQKMNRAIRELQRIELSLDAESEPTPIPARTAAAPASRVEAPVSTPQPTATAIKAPPPPPPSPVGSRSSGRRTPADMSADELRTLSPEAYRKWRDSQLQ